MDQKPLLMIGLLGCPGPALNFLQDRSNLFGGLISNELNGGNSSRRMLAEPADKNKVEKGQSKKKSPVRDEKTKPKKEPTKSPGEHQPPIIKKKHVVGDPKKHGDDITIINKRRKN